MKKNKSRALTKPEASKERKKKLHKTTLSLIEIQNLPKKWFSCLSNSTYSNP